MTPIFNAKQLVLAHDLAQLTHCNPFLHRRKELEKRVLGDRYVDAGEVWHGQSNFDRNPNLDRITALAENLLEEVLASNRVGSGNDVEEALLYGEVLVYYLYHRYQDRLLSLVLDPAKTTSRISLYDLFHNDYQRFLANGPDRVRARYEPGHLFACFFQVRRAFHFIIRSIMGTSLPAARLRATIWESIFTRDLGRYRRTLYHRMHDVPCLITGPTGTGKELVARAIGLSRYIPFQASRRVFAERFIDSFFPLNLSALSPTLIESELFGHCRGAFTGAVQDRMGWLEVCPALGTVFLDEIGEVQLSIQVKLLRVLQSREFQRLGEVRSREFKGKIIAATNRQLNREMSEGRFREDLYYRLCADTIETPSLKSQLRGDRNELETVIGYIALNLVGPEEANGLVSETLGWVLKHLGTDYPWPGNFRELEQCVRNIMIRGTYHPAGGTQCPTVEKELVGYFLDGHMTIDELESAYCTLCYARTPSYVALGKQLGLDRRTVKAKIDRELLDRLKKEGF